MNRVGNNEVTVRVKQIDQNIIVKGRHNTNKPLTESNKSYMRRLKIVVT